MPRGARVKSSSGVYHVMMRGIGRQDIFHDAEDRERFIETLVRFKRVSKYKVYGYCLMDNHIHLLIKEEKEAISQSIKRIGVSYVYWFNAKYERYGTLFQGRFKSENVEDERYLLVVLRYIHQNPLKAGLVSKPAGWAWSSYNEYLSRYPLLVDTDFVLDLLHPHRKEAVEIFLKFMAEENEDKCLEYEDGKRKKSDEEVRRAVQKLVRSDDILAIEKMSRDERNKVIRVLREENVSVRQLARVTGLGRRVIEKA